MNFRALISFTGRKHAHVTSLVAPFLFLVSTPLVAVEPEAKPATAVTGPAVTSSAANSQENETTAAKESLLPGHSIHGEAFDEGPRQKAVLMPGMGNVHFPITTKDPLAQHFFDQGVSQLHGFWYFEAERSFRQVASLDPECAMAYWGMALVNEKNEKRAKSFLAKAVEKKGNASLREIAWIDALNARYTGPDNADSRRQYVRALEALVQEDPSDVEAKAFLALRIWINGSKMTDNGKQVQISSHQAVDALLDQVFAARPMHPAHHYRIHLWDDEKPARALGSAARCGQSVPGIAHMWHMPGHTYSKLHRYADAVWQQEASARVDHAHMMRTQILPDQIHNYAHNNEWLIRNLAFLGRVHEAEALAKNLIELPRHPKYNTPARSNTTANYGLTRLLDIWGQYECWQSIEQSAQSQDFAALDGPDEKLRRQRLQGLAAFGLGKPEEGRKVIGAVEELLKVKQAARYKAADEAEAKSRGEKKSDADVAKAMADALLDHGKGVKPLELVLAELRGYSALAAGDQATAKVEFEKLKETDSIRKDHLARAFLLAGDPAQAETLARAAIEKGPGEVYPLAVLIEVLHQAGKQAEVATEFVKLRPLAAQADIDLPVFQRLAPIAVSLNLPTDWRGPAALTTDSGVRPDLASLGPIHWQPVAAPAWTATLADEKTISLENYRGKPLILLLYLGSGCLHCVEQLQKFAPLTAEFTAAGISIVAVSTEDLASLQGSLSDFSESGGMPFPLAADPEHNVFKAYRAFDDFENVPLHGTFLIDGAGLLRWIDVGAEPFSDAKFLLEESGRLLGAKVPSAQDVKLAEGSKE